MIEQTTKIDFSSVEETALLTLYARAIESQSQNPIIRDEKAEDLVKKLDPFMQVRDTKMARQLLTRSIDPRLVVYISLRADKYDTYAKDFLDAHPQGNLVNIGCGMDTRFFRVDNGTAHFFDLDLPRMIDFKRNMLCESERYKMIPQSVLDFNWMEQISKHNHPSLFLAEGLFMYLEKDEVQKVVLELQKRFPECELVCEVTNRLWVEGFLGKLTSLKMKSRAKMGSGSEFKSGVHNPQELENWGKGLEFKEQWFYMQENHPKLGWMRMFRNWEIFRNTQYTVHYILHEISSSV